MFRKSQVDKLATAAREVRQAKRAGDEDAAARANAIYTAARRNASLKEQLQADLAITAERKKER
ncbi:hypothetical protein [Streptosporangium sandarakinum]|uniref:hypothetical protein n=1 Tax=Streptosporangium sandarakinum TaxID=1260955 RepID=UPI0037238B68